MAAKEKTYYARDDVLITNTRADLGRKTFALANVISVSVQEVKPETGCGNSLLIVGGMLAMVAFPLLATLGWLAIAGAALAVLGFLQVKDAQPTYVVQVVSAAGETAGHRSADREEIAEIVKAIKTAISERGPCPR